MRTRTKIWLMIAASLVLLGCILFAGVMTTLRWDFMDLATVEYKTNIHEISEAFDGISIHADTADIAFALSEDGKCRVECHEEERITHSVAVQDGTLAIELMDERNEYDFIGYIGLNFDTCKITVYLPKTEYASLFIQESTGDIELPKDFQFEDVEIAVSTGDVDFSASASGTIEIATSTGAVKLTDMVCKNVISKGSTGDVILKNVIATEKISLERSTGDVKFDGCDAAEIFVKTDTGDVKGSLLTDKVFIAQSETGKVDVPQRAAGGKCEMITDTGDIKITIENTGKKGAFFINRLHYDFKYDKITNDI